MPGPVARHTSLYDSCTVIRSFLRQLRPGMMVMRLDKVY
ncbi:hypothetical protein PT7_2927 [Pusillimonas sp. T7-7]|nr:hypothetical protein PT7_2927 [Pusillimonas sp. T7-7]